VHGHSHQNFEVFSVYWQLEE